MVDDIAANFGVVGAKSVQEDIHDWNGDWDILYPFSAVRLSSVIVLFLENLELVCPTRMMQFKSPYKIPFGIWQTSTHRLEEVQHQH